MRLTRAVVAALFCVFAVGCSRRPDASLQPSALVGAWSQEDTYMEGGGIVNRYNPDGTFVSRLQGGPEPVRVTGKWRIEGDELVEVVQASIPPDAKQATPKTRRYKIKRVSKDFIERTSNDGVEHFRRRA
jgi:hypothetical protein